MCIKTPFFILFFVVFFGYSQCDSLAVSHLFSKSQLLYANTLSYKVYSNYEFYENSIDPLVELSGIMLKKGDYLYNKMDATETIQEKDKQLIISHSEKLVSYKENVPLQVKTAIDIQKLLPYMDSYYVNEFETGGYECELAPLALSGLPFEEIIITFRKDFSLESQEMLSSKKRSVKDSLGERQVLYKTRMVLCFSELQEVDKLDVLPSLDSFVLEQGEDIILKNRIKKYQKID